MNRRLRIGLVTATFLIGERSGKLCGGYVDMVMPMALLRILEVLDTSAIISD